MRSVVAVVIVVFAGLLLFGPALAQQDAGGLIVSVTDPDGAAVPNARVAVRNVDTNAAVTGSTNALGLWTASPLRPGHYQATVEKEGFRKAVADAVSVGVQETPRVAIALSIGSVTESVTVAAEQARTVLICSAS